MRSKHFLAMAVIGSGLSVVALTQSGCGGNSTGGSGATGGHTTTTTKTTTSSSGTTTVTTGTDTACHQFTCAPPVMVGAAATPGTLIDASTPDYYQFTGKKGDRIIIQTQAINLVQNAPMDGSITDTVVTLYLPDMKTIWAINDDAWPRLDTDSTLWTELPMDGTYYFTIEDCNALAVNNPNVACADPGGITTLDYTVFVGDLTASKTETVGTAAGTPVTYTAVMGMAGSFYNPTLDGDMASITDKQVFTFTPPAFKADATARSRGYFWVQSYGSADGIGTSINIIATAKDMNGNVLATADQKNYTNGDDPMNNSLELSFPLDDQFGNTATSKYTIEITSSLSSAFGDTTKQFYIIDHHAGPFFYGSAEAEGPAGSAKNDTGATAEVLKSPTGVTGAFFIDGNLSAATDVDWYSFTAPAAAKAAFMDCAAARNGSGIQGFTVELFKDAAGTMSLGKLGPEVLPAKKDLNGPTAGYTITGGATVFAKVSATGLDATNKGTFYHCTFSAQ